MMKIRDCGCSGIRTCLICEKSLGLDSKDHHNLQSNKEALEYCCHCEKAWEGSEVMNQHPNHSGQPFDFPGVLLIPEFISEEEEQELIEGCDSMSWDLSVSGRRKQNFGPKTNFKKKKIKCGSFDGFPKFSEFVQKKMKYVAELEDFQTIEQCAIEYRKETGASIDPHIDDCWVWGERVISLSLISDSFLTMNKFKGLHSKYNLTHYYNDNEGKDMKTNNRIINDVDGDGIEEEKYPIVKLPMPRRSLLVLSGAARYEWEHSILRQDINDRRICLAYREFTPEYLEGGKGYHDDQGKFITEKSTHFWDTSVSESETAGSGS